MIKSETLAKVLAKYKLATDEAAAKALIDATDEKTIDIPADIHVFTPAELETRDGSIKSNHTKAGIEIAVKELKEKAGLNYDGPGSKDPQRFLDEFKAHVLKEANISTDDKVKDRDKTIDGLRTKLKELNDAQAAFEARAKDAELSSTILQLTLDKKPENFTNQEWVQLIRMSNELFEEEGKLFVKRAGEVVKDTKMLKPVEAKDALNNWIDERKLGKVAAPAPAPAPGRGGKDSKAPAGGAILNMTQFKQAMAERNIHIGGKEAKALLSQIIKENPAFDSAT